MFVFIERHLRTVRHRLLMALTRLRSIRSVDLITKLKMNLSKKNKRIKHKKKEKDVVVFFILFFIF